MCGVILMALLSATLLCGLVLTVRWGGTPPPVDEAEPPVGAGAALRRALRGAAVVLVAGTWTGLLVTGPAVRLIMRLLAVTGGDRAQRRLTEANEVVGAIDLDGTVGLLLFGGVLPGLVSAAGWVLLRRVLPAGRAGGAAFGLLHLVLFATRSDPLRPDNPDFDLLGPGWLAVLTFGAAVVVHGMAVAALSERYRARLAASPGARRAGATGARRVDVRVVAPLVVPALLVVATPPLLAALSAGVAVALALSRVPKLGRALRSRPALSVARVVVAVVALALLPGTVSDLWDVVDRDRVGATASGAP